MQRTLIVQDNAELVAAIEREANELGFQIVSKTTHQKTFLKLTITGADSLRVRDLVVFYERVIHLSNSYLVYRNLSHTSII